MIITILAGLHPYCCKSHRNRTVDMDNSVTLILVFRTARVGNDLYGESDSKLNLTTATSQNIACCGNIGLSNIIGNSVHIIVDTIRFIRTGGMNRCSTVPCNESQQTSSISNGYQLDQFQPYLSLLVRSRRRLLDLLPNSI